MSGNEQLSLAAKLQHPTMNQHAFDLDDLEDTDEQDGYRAFHVIRQAMFRAEMLDLVFKDGSSTSFAYSHLYRIQFDPSKGIALVFSDHEVEIVGQQMQGGYQRLLSHRVVRVCEADRPTAQLIDPEASVVTAIHISKRAPDSSM